MAHAEQVIDDIEARVALWVIDAAKIGKLLETAAWIVLQELEDTRDLVRARIDHELVAHDVSRAHIVAQTGRDILAEVA